MSQPNSSDNPNTTPIAGDLDGAQILAKAIAASMQEFGRVSEERFALIGAKLKDIVDSQNRVNSEMMEAVRQQQGERLTKANHMIRFHLCDKGKTPESRDLVRYAEQWLGFYDTPEYTKYGANDFLQNYKLELIGTGHEATFEQYRRVLQNQNPAATEHETVIAAVKLQLADNRPKLIQSLDEMLDLTAFVDEQESGAEFNVRFNKAITPWVPKSRLNFWQSEEREEVLWRVYVGHVARGARRAQRTTELEVFKNKIEQLLAGKEEVSLIVAQAACADAFKDKPKSGGSCMLNFSNSSRQPASFACYNCGQEGHKIAECPKPRPGQRGRSPFRGGGSSAPYRGGSRSRSTERRGGREETFKKLNEQQNTIEELKKQLAEFKSGGSKVRPVLIIVRLLDKLMLIDTGCLITVWFILNFRPNANCVPHTLDCIAGKVSAFLSRDASSVDNVVLPQSIICTQPGMNIFGGSQPVDGIAGMDFILKAGGMSIFSIGGIPHVKFGYSPVVHKIDGRLTYRGQGQDHSVVLATSPSSMRQKLWRQIGPADEQLWDHLPHLVVPSEISPEAAAIIDSQSSIREAADAMAIPPGSRILQVTKHKDLAVAAVEVPREDGSKEKRMVTVPNRKTEKVWKPALPHITSKLSPEAIQRLREAIQKMIDEGFFVPIPVEQLRKVKQFITILKVDQSDKAGATHKTRCVMTCVTHNQSLHSFPEDGIQVLSCHHALSILRGLKHLNSKVDISQAFMRQWVTEGESWFQCVNVTGLGFEHDFYRMVRLPFGKSIAPKALHTALDMVYSMFHLTDLVRYFDDQFCNDKDVPEVVEGCEELGYICKKAELLTAVGALGLEILLDGYFRRLKPLPSLSDCGRDIPNLTDILSVIGQYRSHFPIENWLRPALLAIQRAVTITKKNIDPVEFRAKFGRGPRVQKVHPTVIKLCKVLEDMIKEVGDPVRGKFHYNILEPWTMFIDSSVFAHGAILCFGEIIAEDAAWSLREPEKWKTLATDRNINNLELEGGNRSMVLLRKYRVVEESSRKHLKLGPNETREVLILSDNESTVCWLSAAVEEAKKPVPDWHSFETIIPAVSRGMAMRRIHSIIQVQKELNIKFVIQWIPGKLNPADALTRPPKKMQAILDALERELKSASAAGDRQGLATDCFARSGDPEGGSEEPELALRARGPAGSPTPGSKRSIEELTRVENEVVAIQSDVMSDSEGEGGLDDPLVEMRKILSERLARSRASEGGSEKPELALRAKESAGSPHVVPDAPVVEFGEPVRVEIREFEVDSSLEEMQVDRLPTTVPKSILKQSAGQRRESTHSPVLVTVSTVEYLERDEEGKVVLTDAPQLDEIIAGVHYHEGAGELEAVVRTIVSQKSASNLSAEIRSRSRKFVQECEACRMCRPANKTRRAPQPIRFNGRGDPIEITKEEQISLQERVRLQVKRLDQEKKQRFAAASRAFEQIHLDIVGYWQFGMEKRYLITCLDNFSNLVEVKYLAHCPTSQDCANFLRDFVRQAGSLPSRVVCDNGTQFESATFESAVSEFKAKLIFVGSYSHWAAGKIERWHRVLNERVRAAIFTHVKSRSTVHKELSRQYHGQVAVVVDPEIVGLMVRKVVERWNTCPRAKSGVSPHGVLKTYTPWLYSELNAYRPSNVKTPPGTETQPSEENYSAPQVGEVWTVRIKGADHPTIKDRDLPGKLRPLYRYCEIKAVIQDGRYLVLIDGMQQPTRKELEQLGWRVREAVVDEDFDESGPEDIGEGDRGRAKRICRDARYSRYGREEFVSN